MRVSYTSWQTCSKQHLSCFWILTTAAILFIIGSYTNCCEPMQHMHGTPSVTKIKGLYRHINSLFMAEINFKTSRKTKREKKRRSVFPGPSPNLQTTRPLATSKEYTLRSDVYKYLRYKCVYTNKVYLQCSKAREQNF